jgi:hypothetical protein
LHIPPDNIGELPPPKGDPSFELKPLPQELKYAYMDEKNIYPVIISANLLAEEEEKLLEVLKAHRVATGYSLDDLKGISLIRPFCITILYHNLLLFIDIFHI